MNLKIIDTHTHMYLDQFADDIDACMKRALDNHVVLSALPNIDSSTIDAVKQLMRSYPDQTLGMMGLHPCSVKENYQSELEAIYSELKKGSYYAVGEIGIDLYWDKTFANEQLNAFKEQIRWAKDLDLPIVIHARDSLREIFQVLDEVGDENLRGVFHCFIGSAEEAEKALSYKEFFLGIGGVYTFKNSGLAEALANVPLERMVLETDAPYLTPAPHRGKRNETAFTIHVAEKLAQNKGVPLEKVSEITTANACHLFNINV
jgi:TatD DNase family protein